MKKRNLIIEILLVFVIIVLTNLIGGKLLLRLDLTSSKRYTLSSDTINLIEPLEDDLHIEFYISKDIPSYIMNTKKEILGMLNEYAIASKGRIKIKEVNPDKPEMENKLLMYGIQPVNLNIRQKDKYEVVRVYIAIAAFYHDRVESIPVVPGIHDLEYNLTSVILKLLTEKIPIIAYPENNADYDMRKLSGTLLDDLSKQYKVIPVDLNKNDWIKGTDLLILPGFRRNLNPSELYNIDQFVMNGGDLAAFVNGVNIQYEGDSEINRSNLIGLLRAYSITVKPTLVLDMSNELMPYSDGQRNLVSPYPPWIKVLNNFMNPSFEFMKEIPSLILAWTSPVSFSAGDGVSYDVLLNSSPKAWKIEEPFIIHPAMIKPPVENVFSQYILSGIERGVFNSYFSKFESAEGAASADYLAKAVEESKIWVTGNVHMLQDAYLRRFPNNKIFLLNVMDHILMGDRLGAVRSKTVTEASIRELTQSGKTAIKMLNYLMMPILVMLFGVLRLFRRKKIGNALSEEKK